MRIHAPTLSHHKETVRLSARVAMRASWAGLPDTLWFEFPERFQESLSPHSDAFAASLLLLAMAAGEEMEICGSLSPHLGRGLEEYQRIFNIWLPKWFQRIPLHYETAASNEVSQGSGVGCAFSGGVDSFYTLWTHLPANEPIPEYRITHTLFMKGFDIPLTDTRTFETTAPEYDAMMRGLNLQLITGRTNVRDFLSRMDWGMAHGGPLIGSALALAPLFSRFYIPGSGHYRETDIWGSDCRADPMLSTKTLQIVYDAGGFSRAEKTLTIAHWPETFSRLRVCWRKQDGLNNCCRCSKCMRTMLALEICGTLRHYTTFPWPLSRRDIRFCRLHSYEFEQVIQLAQRALEVGRRDIASDLMFALRLSRLRVLAGKMKRKGGRWFRPS